jgi:hypothetical protein
MQIASPTRHFFRFFPIFLGGGKQALQGIEDDRFELFFCSDQEEKKEGKNASSASFLLSKIVLKDRRLKALQTGASRLY